MASSSSQTPSSSVTFIIDPSSSQTPSAFDSTSPPTTWDVFLSFCGEDTRYNFTSYLYDKLVGYGIRTFMDDPELPAGEVITDALIQAIHDSKIYVVVFSENYAASPWCLDELAEIYKCYEKMKRTVIPVYRHINPSVVRHQTESFEKAFKKHETAYAGTMEKMHNWRRALKNVAGISGKHITATRSEANIINEIIDEILLEINPKTLSVAKYPVGLDSRVKEITTLLNSSTEEGVIKFGIYGMGGVGKTTLAKALYNQLILQGSFQGNCFLANVGDVSRMPNGIISLQKQLIDDVSSSKNIFKVNNVDRGINLLRDRIHSKKVLVVLDDLDHHKQFEFLVRSYASGSVVIITTRNEELLDTLEVETKYRYKVEVLDDAESLTLFTRHAFGDAKPNLILKMWAADILHHAGGLPLALEVFGSSLYKQPQGRWKLFIEKLQRIPNSPDITIQKSLAISVDALQSDDPLLKEFFLDIACFFIGCDKDWVVRRMDSYYSYADHYIDILKKRCLLTINDKDQLGMHDLLRDMGREIGRNNYPDKPGKHSRLYASEEICDVLKKKKGTKAIEGIYLSRNYYRKDVLRGMSLDVETFKKMSKLRFLYLESFVSITGNFEHAFEDLRWLYWKYCPLEHLPSNFFPEKLGILELPYSRMRTMWEPRLVTQVLEKLKTLNISYSLDLRTTPDFTKLPCVETLDLEGCKSLVEIHVSIGSLAKLSSLNLCGCVKVRSLPDGICNLRALESFNIGGCSNLEALPSKMGNMKSLTELVAYGLSVSRLPDSIGDLHKLLKLILYSSTNLETLPDSICNLRVLEFLDISDCYNLKALPIELGNVKSLKELNVKCLGVSKIPDSIGCLSKVVDLNLRCNMYLKTIPNTICNMRSLEILNISECAELEILPHQLWEITRLRELHASYATMLTKLPNIESSHIATLTLQELDLSDNGLTVLPSGISQLLKLQDLNVRNCRQLLSITELPPNLENLRASGCSTLRRIQNLSGLKWLEILELSHCSSLTEIVGLEGLTSIKQLHLEGCSSSCVINTLTKSLFRLFSQFGRKIHIHIGEALFPNWISKEISFGGSTEDLKVALRSSTLDLEMAPKMLNDSLFLGIILCYKPLVRHFRQYHLSKVERMAHEYDNSSHKARMEILPRSMLLLTDKDHTHELTDEDDAIVHDIYLLYKD